MQYPSSLLFMVHYRFPGGEREYFSVFTSYNPIKVAPENSFRDILAGRYLKHRWRDGTRFIFWWVGRVQNILYILFIELGQGPGPALYEPSDSRRGSLYLYISTSITRCVSIPRTGVWRHWFESGMMRQALGVRRAQS